MSLTRNGGGNLLTGSQSLTSADNITWTLGGLSGLTAGSGAYMLTLTAAASGIVDGVGNPLAANASDTWTTDAQPPTVDIVDVVPDPRNSAVGQLTIVFSEPISGLDLGDLSLTRNGGGNLLTGSQSLTSANNVTWTLGGLSGLTAGSGAYMLTLTAAGSGIVDGVGNPLVANASDTWTTDAQPPTVDIVDVARPAELGGRPAYDRLQRADQRAGSRRLEPDAQRWRQPVDRQPVADQRQQRHLDARRPQWPDRRQRRQDMLTLTAAGSGIVDGVGNPLAANASDTWTTDGSRPRWTSSTSRPTRGTRRSGSLRSSLARRSAGWISAT